MSHDETNWADALFAQPHFGGSGKPTEDAENAEDAEPEEFQNHVGDGPSGFDYYHDTKWCC